MGQLYLNAYQKLSSGAIAYREIPIGLTTAPGERGADIPIVEENGAIRRTTLTLTALPVSITDDAANGGHGNVLIYTFPRGLTQIFGAKAACTLAGDAAGIEANAAIVCAVGTAPAAIDNATLTLTEADIIQSTACTLNASAGTFSAITTTAPALFDGSSTAKVAYLNLAMPDAGLNAPGVVTVTGTITLSWMVT